VPQQPPAAPPSEPQRQPTLLGQQHAVRRHRRCNVRAVQQQQGRSAAQRALQPQRGLIQLRRAGAAVAQHHRRGAGHHGRVDACQRVRPGQQLWRVHDEHQRGQLQPRLAPPRWEQAQGWGVGLRAARGTAARGGAGLQLRLQRTLVPGDARLGAAAVVLLTSLGHR
jgi:hypothetical protein